MKICILSMQRVNNFGSVLQSYSLRQMLQSLGHEVGFIDIVPGVHELDGEPIPVKRYTGELDSYSASKLGRIARRMDRYLFNRIKNRMVQERQNGCFATFQRETLGLDDAQNQGHYDACVIGSDEVFNCTQEAPWGFTPQLYGDVPQADRVITYAASCGFTRLEDLTGGMTREICRAFDRVSAFSVRDENTRAFVEALTGRQDVSVHLDPVVVGDFDREIEQAKMTVQLPERYLLVYAYPNRIHEQADIDRILRFCKAHDVEPVAVGMQQKWIRRVVPMSPFELLKAVGGAEYVLTDTFHGAIFSAKYARRFAIITRDSNRNKLQDLVDRMGVADHVLTDLNQLEGTLLLSHDKAAFRRFEAEARRESLAYLKNSLG